jgi:hypothetical protein
VTLRGRALLVALVILVIVAASGGTARAAVDPSQRFVKVQSVPATAGLPFSFAGTTRITGRDGSVEFALSRQGFITLQQNPFGIVRALSLAPKVFGDGTTYQVQRWYVRSVHGVRVVRAAIDEFIPTRIGFVDPKSGAFAAGKVDWVRLKRSDGAVFTFSGKRLERPVLLKATRVVPLAGGLVSKRLLYRVESVTIEGNNLVNRAQQAFLPKASRNVTLKLLFYSAKFTARDRIFRFPVGSSLTLEFPNGRTHDYKLDSSGTLVLPALPRGNYRVTIHASGLKMRTPIAMTRDQVATINVVSYLDVATVIAVLCSIAAGLLLVGRPGLRRSLRRGLRRRGRDRDRSTEAVEA